jgi:hypothetical protein
MLSVIIDARMGTKALPALLAQLTAGVVDGLVRQVAIVARGGEAAVDALCEDMGAEPHATVASAARAARSDRILYMPADLRLRDGWTGALEAHLAAGGERAIVVGLRPERFLARTPKGALVERRLLEQVADGVDGPGVLRLLRLGRRRIG